MTEIASIQAQDANKVRECMEKISISSQYLISLINDILDMSKIESGKMVLATEPFCFGEWIESLSAVWTCLLYTSRHDSMYVMLVPCMYFLFQLLTIPKGKTPKGLRSCSMLIYLLHPMTILVARALAKGLNAQAVLLLSLIHI